MKTQLLVEDISKEELLNNLQLLINAAIDKKLQPVTSLLDTVANIILERKEAAKILEVSAGTIDNMVVCKKLVPVFTEGCSRKKFKLIDLLSYRNIVR